jgi:hypothetical protein
MSPGSMPGFSARFSRIHLTVSAWELDKYCRYGPRNTRSPDSLRIEGWKSRVTIVTGETASRWIVCPCSRLVFIIE